MADISALGNLNTEETLDTSTYAAASSGFQLPRKGRYTVTAPEIADTAFGKSASGSLTAQVDPIIVDSGLQIRFTRVSAKTFPRGKGKASQMGDYLKAMLGSDITVPGDPQELATLVQQTSGRTCDVLIDWRVYNKNTGLAIEGMDNFPKDADGNPIPYVTDPKDINPETGEPRRLRANLNVVKWLPSNA